MTTTSLLAIIAWTTPAHAWECMDGKSGCTPDCIEQPGSSSTYHINTSDLSSAEIDEIELGADAWTAGAGELVRGAGWAFVRGSDVSTDGSRGDGVNTVRMKSQFWFNSIGVGGSSAVNQNVWDGCDIIENDVSYNDSKTWVTDPYSVTGDHDVDTRSIGQITVHEFGHALGLAHEYDYPNAMNPAVPNGGDFAGQRYRISEDDYVALENSKGDSSTGYNLMLGRWVETGSSGSVEEVWCEENLTDISQEWEAYPGDTIATEDGPLSLLAVWVGTGGGGYVDFKWYLTSGPTCATGTRYTLATRDNYLMSVDSPTVIEPASGYTVPSVASSGTYKLCATIDYTDDHTETSESDNTVVSELDFEVL